MSEPRELPGEPLEPETVEYFDPSAVRPAVETRTVVIEGSSLPCCPTCGCLLAVLALLLLVNFGGVLATIVLLIAAAWISAFLLQAAGVNRVSPFYVFLMVPMFLTVANLGTRLFRGEWAYSAGEIAGGTLVIYAFLLIAQALVRRR